MNVRPEARAAGFWLRAAAMGVDMAGVAAVAGAAVWALRLSGHWPREEDAAVPAELVLALWAGAAVLFALVSIGCWWRCRGTPGQMLLGCQVVDARSSGRVGIVRCVLRLVALAMSLAALGLGVLWILWDRDKQGWHDKALGTRVVVEDESLMGLDELVGRDP